MSVVDPSESWVSVVDSSVFNTVITPSSTRTFQLQFTALVSSGLVANDIGVNTASLVLNHNAERAGESDTVSLTLSITAPELQVTVPAGADKTVDSGDVISVEEDIAVDNIGDYNLILENIAVTCGADTWLSVLVDFDPNIPRTITPGDGVVLSLAYDIEGMSGGTHTCTVAFDHDAPTDGQQHIVTVNNT